MFHHDTNCFIRFHVETIKHLYCLAISFISVIQALQKLYLSQSVERETISIIKRVHPSSFNRHLSGPFHLNLLLTEIEIVREDSVKVLKLCHR